MGEKKKKKEKKDKPVIKSKVFGNKHSIESFLAEHDKLLAGFGIFLAVTLFSKDYVDNQIGRVISFFFLTATLLIWLELWASFPSKNRSWTLITFENLINFGTIFLLIYWITDYYQESKMFILPLILLIIGTILTKVNDKYEIFDSIKKSRIWKHTIIRYLFGFLFFAVIIFITVLLTALIMGGLDPLMEEWKTSLKIE